MKKRKLKKVKCCINCKYSIYTLDGSYCYINGNPPGVLNDIQAWFLSRNKEYYSDEGMSWRKENYVYTDEVCQYYEAR